MDGYSITVTVRHVYIIILDMSVDYFFNIQLHLILWICHTVLLTSCISGCVNGCITIIENCYQGTKVSRLGTWQ